MADTTHTPVTARPVPVPPEARALSTLPRIDYENALIVDTDPTSARTSEQWVREVLEGAPADMRKALRQGWSALGLRLDSAPPDQLILGWTIRHNTPDSILLGAESPRGLHGELLIHRQTHTVLFASFIHLSTDQARALWAGVEHQHPVVMRELLEDAVRRSSA